MEQIFAVPLTLESTGEWVDVGDVIPADRYQSLAAAAVSDKAVQIRILQGVSTAPSVYRWVRASGPSEVPAGAPGPGLLAAVGFPRARLQVLNDSGSAAEVTVYVTGLAGA